jgi:flagellar biosynthesis/type III secretory pathway protein FliH
MPKYSLTLRKPIHSIDIIKKDDIEFAEQYTPKLDNGEMNQLIDEIIQNRGIINHQNYNKTKSSEKVKISKPVFIEEFSISNSNEPVQISLSNVIEESLMIEDVKKEVQSAYDDGFKDGQQVTKSIYEAEIQKHLEWIRNFDIITEEFKKNYFSDMKKLEDSLISLAIMVSEHILGHETTANSNLVIEQCRKAINSLSNETIFKIYLHPDNIEILTSVNSGLVIDSTRLEGVVLIADETVDKLGCILETSAGKIDARLKTQLEKIHSALLNVSINPDNEDLNDIS